jgi:hypothetical protein
MKFIATLLFVLCTSVIFSQTTEVLTNQTIISLQSAGLGKEVIKSKIQSSTCSFDVSTQGLIQLKKAAVPDEIIAAMLGKNSSVSTSVSSGAKSIPHSSGIYYLDINTNEYNALEPSILTNRKSGGLGEAFGRSITGLFNAKEKASLSGKQASLQFNTNDPLFLFVFDSTSNGFKNSNTFIGNPQSPNEFFLVKLTVKGKSREIVVGKENNIKSDYGIDDDVKVSFNAKKLSNGVYEITTSTQLKKGEYCFMFAASSMSAGQTHKVYDFSIK